MRCAGRQRVCSRWKEFREAGQAATRGRSGILYTQEVVLLTWPLREQWYTSAHHKEMPLKSIARLIQTMLYAVSPIELQFCLRLIIAVS